MLAAVSSSQQQVFGGFNNLTGTDSNASSQAMQSLQEPIRNKQITESQNSQKNDGNFSGGFGGSSQGTNNPAHLGQNVDTFV